MSAKCQKRTFSSLAKCQPWLRSPNLQQLPAMFTASALLRCHHVDMQRHNGNLLAPTFEALGFAVASSEIVSVRSNVASHFWQRY
jgi:hypothetical protein